MTPREEADAAAYLNASEHEKQLYEKYRRLGGYKMFSQWFNAGKPKKDIDHES